jgi:hypothetical protein
MAGNNADGEAVDDVDACVDDQPTTSPMTSPMTSPTTSLTTMPTMRLTMGLTPSLLNCLTSPLKESSMRLDGIPENDYFDTEA